MEVMCPELLLCEHILRIARDAREKNVSLRDTMNLSISIIIRR